MSIELVPVDNMAAVEALDPQAREMAVTHMLSEARAWLAHAVESTSPQTIANFKAQMATIAEATKQLNLSKEIQLDAIEMVRRAERGVGLAIRKGQADGRFATPQTARKLSISGAEIDSTTEFFSSSQGMTVTRALLSLRGGSKGLVQNASRLREVFGSKVNDATAAAIVELLNKARRGSKRLPSWFATADAA